jgi:hypothetical protein
VLDLVDVDSVVEIVLVKPENAEVDMEIELEDVPAPMLLLEVVVVVEMVLVGEACEAVVLVDNEFDAVDPKVVDSVATEVEERVEERLTVVTVLEVDCLLLGVVVDVELVNIVLDDTRDLDKVVELELEIEEATNR